MRHWHRNPNGNWCKCPWGPYNRDPYISPHDREALGSAKESVWHEASKFDWLMDRPDMQDEDSQSFLNYLQLHLPDHDPLFPWLVREWRKGRIKPQTFYPGENQDTLPFTYTTDQGWAHGLESEDLEMLQNWMKYKKQNKQGVDIMGHHIGQVLPEASKWDAGGEDIYDDGNFKLTHLRNKRDLRVEGRRMNHCIGSNGMNYADHQAEGEGLYYSVRHLHNNEPVGTLEFGKNKEEYFKCGHCGAFVPGKYERKINPALGREAVHLSCDECGNTLLSFNPETKEAEFSPGTKEFPVHLGKMAHKPDARFMKAAQFYGPNDGPVDHNALNFVNDFFGQHGHPYIEPSAGYNEDEEDNEYDEPQDLEDLGYQNQYDYDPPDTIDDLIALDKDPHALAPEEYQRAVRAAEDSGFAEPELEQAGSIDWSRILGEITDDPNVNPEEINQVFQIARRFGKANELLDASKRWLENDYHPFLDPYGRREGPGYIPDPSSPGHPIIGPKGMDGFHQPRLAPSEPGSHFPGRSSYPHEEYIARNLQHQIDKYEPPNHQTGQPQTHFDFPQVFPEYSDSYDSDTLNHIPQFPGGQQQGVMFSPWVYVDIEKQQAKLTQLPEHLFPPERYDIHHSTREQQTPLWEQQRGTTGPYTHINTIPATDRFRIMDETDQDPAMAEWTASTKESGPWTDYEKERGVIRDPLYGLAPGPHQGDVHNNGSIIQFAPKDSWYFQMPGFEWRVPVLHHIPTGRTYFGKEGMEHGDLARQFSLPKPWTDKLVAEKDIQPGFIDTTGEVGTGGLEFYGAYEPPNAPELHQWVEDQYGVRKHAPPTVPTNSEIWSSYHPRQDDEWVAEDIADFSATIPEGRWNHD